MTKPTVAAVEEIEMVSEEWNNTEMEEDTVTVPMSQFLSMATQAGVELSDESMIAAADEINFC